MKLRAQALNKDRGSRSNDGNRNKRTIILCKKVYDGLLQARGNAEKEEIKGLEKAITVLTYVTMEMGRSNEKGR